MRQEKYKREMIEAIPTDFGKCGICRRKITKKKIGYTVWMHPYKEDPGTMMDFHLSCLKNLYLAAESTRRKWEKDQKFLDSIVPKSFKITPTPVCAGGKPS